MRLFFPDRPVRQSDDNILWNDKDDIVGQQIEDIAQRLIEPINPKSEVRNSASDSITFAIHGDWGAGKSSFQSMIRDRAEKLEQEFREGPISKMKFCEYIASSYVNLDVDVRTTLAMQVLTALADGVRSKALESYETTSPDPRSTKLNSDLQSLATYLSRLVDFPDLLSKELQGKGKIQPFGEGVSGILVVMIDDLDRCPLQIVTEILSITQQWGKVQNLFFILAINQNVLLKAIKESAPEKVIADPDYALEKYVQHTVTVPSLDNERLKKYVQALLRNYNDEVSLAISNNVTYLEKGLRYKTPRAVKRCLNTIRPDIKAQISSGQDPKKVIKERVLQYSWREFYTKFFIPSVQSIPSRPIFQKAWEDLESACRAYVQEAAYRQDFDDEKLDFLIKRVKGYYRDTSFPEFLDRELVRYLAEPPFWLLNISSEEIGQKDAASRIPSLVDESLLRTVNLDIDQEFMRLYDSHRIAAEREQPHVNAAMQYALEAAQLVENNLDVIPSHRADEVGNLAFKAERFGFIPFADVLFQLALKLKPNHPNNMRGYISFIADAELKSQYETAFELLQRLETDFSEFKPQDVLNLKVQMNRLVGKEMTISDEQIQEILKPLATNPDNDKAWQYAMLLASRLERYDLLLTITEKTLQPEFANSFTYVYQRIRVLADTLSSLYKPPEARKEAMEMYRRLLLKREKIDADSVVDIMHNYAILLYAADYDDEAGKLWYEAYKLNPNDQNIRSTYSSYLVRGQKGELAQKVQAGEAIDEMFLQPVNQVMPDQFSNADYIVRFFSLFDQL